MLDLPWKSLQRRNERPEVMDQPGLDQRLHRQALRGLSRVNLVSGSVAALWEPIARLAAKMPPGHTIRVLDVACGGGDVAIGLKRRGRARGVPLRVEGCDISPTALEFANERASRRRDDLHFFHCDVLREELPDTYDVVCTSLFLHHLSEPQAVELLKRMARATRHLVLVDDLVRSSLGYCLAAVGTRLLSRSPVVHVDGLLSVAQAFTVTEVRLLADRAGLNGARIQRHWPQRYLLAWSKN